MQVPVERLPNLECYRREGATHRNGHHLGVALAVARNAQHSLGHPPVSRCRL